MKHRINENVLKRMLFYCFLILSFGIYAQNGVISGKITDAQGVPLPGANVVQKGTSNGVVADFDGNYEITLVDGSQILVFSYVGYRCCVGKVAGLSTKVSK